MNHRRVPIPRPGQAQTEEQEEPQSWSEDCTEWKNPPNPSRPLKGVPPFRAGRN